MKKLVYLFLLIYFPTFGQFTIFNSHNSNLKSNFCSRLTIDLFDNPWIGHADIGASIYKDNKFTNFNNTNSPLNGEFISFLLPDEDKIYLSEFEHGIFKFENNLWERVIDIPDFSIYGMFKQQNSNYMWISTKYSGVFRYNLQSKEIVNFSGFNELPTNYTFRITGDAKGQIYVGTGYEGAVKYDGTKWEVFNTENSGLPNDDVYAVACDKNNNTWFGTFNGLAKLNIDGTWELYNTQNSDLPDNYIRNIICKDEIVIIATARGGLAIFNTLNNKWKVFNTSNSNIPSDQVWDIALNSKGDLWIALLEHGLAKLSNIFENPLIDSMSTIIKKPIVFFDNTDRSIYVTVKVEKDTHYSLFLLDVLGKKIKEFDFIGSGNPELQRISVQNYPSAIYILVFKNGSSVLSEKFLIYD